MIVSDLTILLYTANRLPESVAARIRAHLAARVADRYPLVSVSQKPIDFPALSHGPTAGRGLNICVGDIGANKYNAYKQIFIGVQTIDTEYVATVDDDTLYDLEHFAHRPCEGAFLYETNYWFCQDGLDYYWRAADPNSRGGMWGCIAHTETLRANLAARFERYPENPWAENQADPPRLFWGEPGDPSGDRQYGRRDSRQTVFSPRPCLVFVHQAAMGYTQLSRYYRRYGRPTPENTAEMLPGFGSVADVRARFWKEQALA